MSPLTIRFRCAQIALPTLVILSNLTGVLVSDSSAAQLGALLRGREKVEVVDVDSVRKRQIDHEKAVAAAAESGSEPPVPDFILVDARSKEETAVSLIPGAITTRDYEQNLEKYEGRQVIAYCTSGYRSDQLASKLLARGIDAVNMKASMLGWCQAKLPLVGPDGKKTNRVHTYSSKNKVPAMYRAVH